MATGTTQEPQEPLNPPAPKVHRNLESHRSHGKPRIPCVWLRDVASRLRRLEIGTDSIAPSRGGHEFLRFAIPSAVVLESLYDW